MFRVDPGFFQPVTPSLPAGYALALIAIPSYSKVDENPIPDRSYVNSDEFKMYEFKVKRCPNKRAHDWTECPWAHPGERARRRDPRRVGYVAVPCSEFRAHQRCQRGDRCRFAHGVFEYWLHPARYRTRACTSAANCTRKVCFFAHDASQLRPETRYRFMPGGDDSKTVVDDEKLQSEGVNGRDDEGVSSWDLMEYECVDEMPHVEWIRDLIGWEGENKN